MNTYFEILRNLTDETLEGKFSNEQLARLLVTSNFAERDRPRAKAVGLLYPPYRLCRVFSWLQ